MNEGQSHNTSNTNMTPESTGMKNRLNEKGLTTMEYNNRNTVDDPPNLGVLDDFLTANGPRSVTIKAEYNSPDKTNSEMSCLSSPDVVSLFPAPENRPRDAATHSSSDNDAEGISNNDCSISRNLVRVKIESSVAQNSASFHITVPIILQREVEMQAAARANNVGKERWTSSRIFRMWKSQRAKQQQKILSSIEHESSTTKSQKLESIVLRMTPEVSLQHSNSSCSFFRWKPWLTTCIQTYYNTGNLTIPDECSGDDILVAMEYFGILTASPGHFVFHSRDAYARVQAWSRYFTYRVGLVESLLEAYDDVEVEESKNLSWVLVEENGHDEKDDYYYQYDIRKKTKRNLNNGQQKGSLEFHSENRAARKLIVGGVGGLYELFCETNESKGRDVMNPSADDSCEKRSGESFSSKVTSLRIRQDFCLHLRHFLPPWSVVRFDMELVKSTSKVRINGEKTIDTTIHTKPVIRIEHDQCGTLKTLPYHKGNYCTFVNTTSEITLADDKVTTSAKSSVDKIKISLDSIKNTKRYYDKDMNGTYMLFEIDSALTHEKGFGNSDGLNRKNDTAHLTREHRILESVAETSSSKTPITHVNMELGDLRSVTSVLSEPLLDDIGTVHEMHSTMKSLNRRGRKENHGGGANFTTKRIVQERSGKVEQKNDEEFSSLSRHLSVSRSDLDDHIETPPRTTRRLFVPPPWDLDQYPDETKEVDADGANRIEKDETVIKDHHEGAERDERINKSKGKVETKGSEWDDEHSGSKSEAGATDLHGSWGQLLASVCEVLIPVDSRNALSSSPIRNFTIRSNKSTESTVASSDEENRNFHNCQGRGHTECQSQASGFVDQAKKIGNDLSNHFDELMKIAYNEKDTEDHSDGKGYNSLSPVLQEVPEILAIDTGEDNTLSSCLTTSIVGQPLKIRGSDTFEKSREMNHLHHSHIPTVTNYTCGIPKSKSFELDPFVNSGIAVPRRTMQGRGSQLALSVARKKSNYRPISGQRTKPNILGRQNLKLPDHVSPVTQEPPGIAKKSYNKENRHSRHKNRFYS